MSFNGQIWIDKNSPYSLKYIANNTEFSLSGDAGHIIDVGLNFSAGTVLAFDEINKFKAAKFPDDINSVVGIAGNTTNSAVHSLTIKTEGVITLTPSETAGMFGNELSQANSWIGAPVYWKISKPGDTDFGKLTLMTPSGKQWKITAFDDQRVNIKYHNLPIIGFVEAISNDGAMDILLSFTGFNTLIRWSWPNIPSGGISLGQDGIMDIHHFLPLSNANCTCEVTKTVSSDTYQVFTTIENVIDTSGGDYTRIYLGNIANNESFEINGFVNYKG